MKSVTNQAKSKQNIIRLAVFSYEINFSAGDLQFERLNTKGFAILQIISIILIYLLNSALFTFGSFFFLRYTSISKERKKYEEIINEWCFFKVPIAPN